MFSTEEFKTFADANVMLAHVTTRIEGRKNDGLLSEKGGRGFPTIIALDTDGNKIAEAGGRSVEAFEKMMVSASRFVEISGKAEKTLDDRIFLFKHQIDMGTLKFAEAKKLRGELEGLSDEQNAEIDTAMVDLEIQDALGNPTSREEADAFAKAAGPKFIEMMKAGKKPTSDAAYQPFYILIMNTAFDAGDAETFEKALGMMRAKFGDNARAAGWFDGQEKRLEELKSASDDSDSEETEDKGGM